MKHLVVGFGEIGRALASVLECDARDVEEFDGEYDVLHVCFPYADTFVEQVLAYREHHRAEHVVVHSTVPVGTCWLIGACHSPVTGVHPHLADSLRTFRKPVGGPKAELMAEELQKFGIPAEVWSSSDATEAGKLYALLIYGVNVLLEKEAHEFCRERRLDYSEVYGKTVDLYNDGYEAMGMPRYRMYRLKHMAGPLGGHCVAQNAPRLGTRFAALLAELDAELRGKMSAPCSSTPTPPAKTS